MAKPLPFDEKKALELYGQGLNDKQIADELHVLPGIIGRWRGRRGLSANHREPDGGTRPEVTVEIPPGLRSARETQTEERSEPDADEEAGEGCEEPPALPGPPPGWEEEPVSISPGCMRDDSDPVTVSVAYKGFSLYMRAPTLDRAAEAADLLQFLVGGLATVSKSDTRQDPTRGRAPQSKS